MKQVVFKAVKNGKIIRGSWFCDKRPNRAQTVAERLLKGKISRFMFVVKDIKEHMIYEGE